MPLGSTTEQHSPPLERQLHDEGESISNFQPTQTPRARVLATLRTISWHLLPIFCLLNCLNYLDRSNLSFALIQMSQDLNLTQEEYGIGAGLFFVGYTTCQIPSQLVLQHIGAPNWLGVIVTVWGVIACFMAAVRSPASFYVVRLMLGAAEAGSFPGSWYYLTKFYPDNHIALPYSITDSAIMVSQVIGAPLAAGVLQLNQRAGLAGWQWLFLLEGVPTALLGIMLPMLLPASLVAARWLSRANAELVQREVDASRLKDTGLSVVDQLKLAFSQKSIYVLGAVKFTKDLTFYGIMFWAPALIKNFLHGHRTGQNSCKAWEHRSEGDKSTGYMEVLLTGIPYTVAVGMSMVFAWHSQRSHDRKCHIAVAYAIAGLVCALLPVFHRAGVVAEFIALTVVIVLCLCPNGCLLALASAAGRGPAMSLSLAVFNSIANLAGLFGPMLMGSVVHRTCSYDVAFIVLGVVLMLGALLALTVEDSVEECDHAAVLTGLAVEMSTGPEKGGTGYQSAPSISPERSEGNKARGMGSHADMDIADEL